MVDGIPVVSQPVLITAGILARGIALGKPVNWSYGQLVTEKSLCFRQYYSNSTVNSWFKCVQQTTVTEWHCGLTVALRLATPVTRGSQSVPYFLVYFS